VEWHADRPSVLAANLESSTHGCGARQFQPDAQAGYDLSAHVLNIIKGRA
jgi:hypothetical protein